MLIASSDRVFETSRVHSTLVLERRFRVHVLHRERLLFDSRFSPSPKKGAAGVTLYFVIAGDFQHDGHAMQAPLVFALAEDEFERMTPASATFRSWGDPSVTIELRVPASHVRRPIGLAAGPRRLSERTWARCSTFTTACFSGEPDESLVQAWLVDLVEDGLASSCRSPTRSRGCGPPVARSTPTTRRAPRSSRSSARPGYRCAS